MDRAHAHASVPSLFLVLVRDAYNRRSSSAGRPSKRVVEVGVIDEQVGERRYTMRVYLVGEAVDAAVAHCMRYSPLLAEQEADGCMTSAHEVAEHVDVKREEAEEYASMHYIPSAVVVEEAHTMVDALEVVWLTKGVEVLAKGSSSLSDAVDEREYEVVSAPARSSAALLACACFPPSLSSFLYLAQGPD